MRFPLPDKAAVQDRMIDTASGDHVTVPVRAQHTFSNPFDEEASNSFMPAFYINYFKLIQSYLNEGLPVNAATNKNPHSRTILWIELTGGNVCQREAK
jgi:hypothetical protein